MQPNVKQQIVESINQANNLLVTVSANPSVDQLAAAIGFALMLNKLGKHATAVFSGQIPSTIEFLQPEKTLEKNTDSLRDFIIALDKSKADKLRYKVEDKVVKIFITPYRTSISEKDLEFSQGDFNVEVVLALGVNRREDLDQTIVAHGRILHDATVISISKTATEGLGSLNWQEPAASSLSEMVASLAELLKPDLLDAQMATALLTGIVAETDRFSNIKTSPQTMAISAKLMAAGANQQLIAAKLDEPQDLPQAVDSRGPKSPANGQQTVDSDGTLNIRHDTEETPGEEPKKKEEPELDQIHIDEHGTVHPLADNLVPKSSDTLHHEKVITPPSDKASLYEPRVTSAQLQDVPPVVPPSPTVSPPPPANTADLPPLPPPPKVNHDITQGIGGAPHRLINLPPTNQTLEQIEEAVHSPHVAHKEQPPAQPLVSSVPTHEDKPAAPPPPLPAMPSSPAPPPAPELPVAERPAESEFEKIQEEQEEKEEEAREEVEEALKSGPVTDSLDIPAALGAQFLDPDVQHHGGTAQTATESSGPSLPGSVTAPEGGTSDKTDAPATSTAPPVPPPLPFIPPAGGAGAHDSDKPL